ncbi:hypothetical protein CR513_58578, partial [Mucuna pruriens]
MGCSSPSFKQVVLKPPRRRMRIPSSYTPSRLRLVKGKLSCHELELVIIISDCNVVLKLWRH